MRGESEGRVSGERVRGESVEGRGEIPFSSGKSLVSVRLMASAPHLAYETHQNTCSMFQL